MGIAGKSATFMRKARHEIHHYLALILVVSTLSAISVAPASATARTVGSGACAQAYTFNSGSEAFSVIEDSGFCYISFRNSGAAGSSSSYTWTKPAGVTSLNVLVVGGGGGGGARHGGGGGAGSYVEAIGLATPSIATSINVIVGAGGAGAAGGGGPYVGSKGIQSTFRIGTTNGLVALGGGAGINGSDVNIVDGGSGGGAGASQTPGDAITSTQRELQSATTISNIESVNVGAAGASDPNSGTSFSRDYWAAGGGGGAGARGQRPSVNNNEISEGTTSFSDGSGTGTRAGNGGVGKIPSSNLLSSSIASQLSVGQVVSGQVYFAGGGGGGMGADGEAGGSGGLGGGGNGTKAVSTGGVSGLVSTGGGGGGSGFDDISPVAGDVVNPPGGAGGSGVVVVRYAATYTVTYNYNSATGGNSTASSNFTTGGTTITLPTPTRTGYTFGGWFVASDFSGSALVSPYSPTSSLTIHAKWNAKSCTLTDPVSGGYTTVTFTSVQDCAWTVPAGVTVADVLVVGGGGGGSGNRSSTGAGGSGGGGGVYNATSVPVSGLVTVTVGSGGTAGTSGSTAAGRSGLQGDTSAFGTLTAGGGGGGGCETTATSGQPCGAGTSIHGRPGTAGGNGGSPSEFWNAYNYGSAGTSTGAGVTAYRGGFYNDGGSSTVGAAGSAGGAGGAGNRNTPGAGVTSPLTGSTVYGRGGASWNATSWNLDSPPANSGFGGNGGYSSTGVATNGIDGASGVVVVRYVSTYTVTYSYSGADAGNSTASSTFTPAGSAIILPTPTKTGFAFSGWYTASSGGSLVGAGGANYSPTGTNPAITVHAQWTAPSGTVSVPSAPNAVTATAANVGIELTWGTPVSLAGRTISGYQVEYSTTGAANDWTVASSSIASNATSYTISGLTNGTPYYVRIAALFSGGRGAYGYPWQKIYGTVSPTRSSNAIAYEAGFGTTAGDAFSQFSSFTRIRYLMKATYGGNANYADVDFAKGLKNASSNNTSGYTLDTTSNIRIPSLVSGQDFITQGDVYDLSVLSNVTSGSFPSAVQNGYGFNGRVEIWPWNYGVDPPVGTSSRTSGTYDDGDSTTLGAGSIYGSFQLHNITNGSTNYRQTVLAWNLHQAGYTPEIGFGSHTGTHSDWTFCGSNCASRTNFSMEIFVNAPITPAGANAEQSAPTGLTGVAPSTFGASDGKITGTTTAMEYKLSSGSTYITASSTETTGLAAGTYDVRFAAKTGFNAGTVAQVTIAAGANASQAAPTGLTGVAPSTIGAIDGKITGTTTAMEYKLSSNSTYITASATETTGLAAGTYDVRFTAKTGFNAGTVATVTVNNPALTPIFGTPTRTSDGFTVTITNFDAAFTWETATVTSGSVSVTSTSGSNRVLTVTGLNPGASATITQTTSRAGYLSGSATVTGTASVTITSLSISGVTAPVRGATPVTTVTAGTGYTGTVTWAAGGTPLVGNFAAGTVYTATITLTASAGYTFSGVTANSFTVSGATATNLINSGVISAVFPSTMPSITYSPGTGGSGTAPSSPIAVAIGSTFTTPFSLYTRAGFSFAGWSDGTNTYAANATYPATGTVTGNVVLTAQWTGVTYTVLFVYNGRTGGDSEASKEYTTGGPVMTLPTPTRTGYTFGGWFSNVALTSSVGNAGANYEPTVNLTLYAKWNAINYTVTYNSTNVVGGSTINSASGTVPTDSANYNIGQSVSVKSNSGSLARTGYSFAGWVTSADGTGTAVNSGQTIEMGSESINLYPKWSANTYTITYNLNGGAGDMTSAPASWTVGNSDVTLPTTGITRTGYTFGNGSGGYWSSSQGGAAVANTYSNIGNVTLYAIWTVKTIAYSFSKGTADGLTIANFPVNASNTFGSTITLPNLAGTTVSINSNTHLFTGWSFNNTIYRSSDSFVLSEAEPTFTAIWTRLYDVRYGFAGGTKAAGDVETDSGDSECQTSGLCEPNQIITLRGAPTRTGYQFAGWKVQDTATIKAAGSTETITATTYLFYGQWTAIDYEFSFNSTGGSNVFTNETKNIGQLLTLPDPGFKTGYVFAGWSADSGTTKLAKGSTYVVGTSSLAFVAIWTPNVYTIVFDWQGATGSVTPNATYTVGTGNLALPAVENRVKDGYIFAGWGETTTATALINYQPASNKVLYALWADGNYSLTLNGNGATVASQVIAVPRNTSYTLPTRTRPNFKFVGWFDSATGGNFIGDTGLSYLVPASQTLYARWVQDSFFGVDEATLETASTFTASNSTGVDSTITHNPSDSSARIQIQAGALTPGTVITVRYFKETSRQQSLIGADKNYFFSVLVSWILGSGATATVPDTAADKPILVTLTNPAIKAGAMVYRVIGGVVSELQRATVDGSITVELRTDPELVIAAIKPTAPRSVTATSTGSGTADISWLAPTSNGGSAVIEYTAFVAADPTKSCVTVNLTCTISGLSNSTSYSFVVTATNGVGVSPNSTAVTAETGSVYTVTYDSKGGSPVANGSFFSGSTVEAPTAPSKAGYTFAGWSASDGGSAVTFPYAPGVTTNITLYARWNALSYTVTFDSKGGTPVPNSSFLTASTVDEPTAPSRSGFTFAGWSATDGGATITFPYTPGVITAITLYAKWTAISQQIPVGGGGGTVSSEPAPSLPVVPITPAPSNITVVAPVVVVGNQDAKVIAIDIAIPATGSTTKPPVIKIDKASEKFIAEIKVVDGKLVLTPETGFSGKRTVTVTITENGVDRIVQIPLTVLPETVTKPVLTPTASNRSVIRWAESPNATTYTVLLNGKRVCSTSAITCTVNRILGPDAVIEIVSNGGDRTVSQKIGADFKQTTPVSITRLVSATITKSSLTAVDTKALDKVIGLIKSQGFGTVVISQITTTSKTKALAAARIESIKKYITSKIGTEEVEFEITPVKSRTYFNNISVKG
jgi:uncharacterized repeat protein (TIGR02543 family)